MSCEHEQNNCIKCVPIFSNLNEDEMMEIALITYAKTFVKGEMVYTAGDKGGKLFVLHTGKVKITRLSANGKEQVIRVIGAGEFMGELSLFSALPLSDNAQAIEAATMCIIEGQKIKELMTKYSSIAFKILDELSKRLENAENLIEAISLNTVEQRLAQGLLALLKDKDQRKIILSSTKSDFASQLSMSQETLSRKLSALQDEGIIKLTGQRTIFIKDKEKLIAASRQG